MPTRVQCNDCSPEECGPWYTQTAHQKLDLLDESKIYWQFNARKSEFRNKFSGGAVFIQMFSTVVDSNRMPADVREHKRGHWDWDWVLAPFGQRARYARMPKSLWHINLVPFFQNTIPPGTMQVSVCWQPFRFRLMWLYVGGGLFFSRRVV